MVPRVGPNHLGLREGAGTVGASLSLIGPAIDTATQSPTGAVAGRRLVWLAGAGILLTAFNLRAVVTSAGALLPEIQAATGMSGTAAGVLTTLPPICFGVFGFAAGWIGRRYGARRTVAWAIGLIAIGLATRVLTDQAWVFIALTVPGLAGMAAGNILLPVLVKTWFPRQIGRATGMYTLVMAVGTAIPAAVSVPIEQASGSWELGLGVWALPALVALLPWLLMWRAGRRDRPVDTGRDEGEAGGPGTSSEDIATRVRHNVQSWALAAFFGLQSLGAYVVMGWLPSIYRDAGVAAGTAGLLLALVTLLSGISGMALPEIGRRFADQRPLVALLVASQATGILGLLVAPASLALVWAVLIGFGMGAFPLALMMIGLRAGTSAGTAQLSSLVQGFGYLLAAGGPVAIGALHDATDGWTLPLVVLLSLLVPMFVAGRIAGRRGHVDAA